MVVGDADESQMSFVSLYQEGSSDGVVKTFLDNNKEKLHLYHKKKNKEKLPFYLDFRLRSSTGFCFIKSHILLALKSHISPKNV